MPGAKEEALLPDLVGKNISAPINKPTEKPAMMTPVISMENSSSLLLMPSNVPTMPLPSNSMPKLNKSEEIDLILLHIFYGSRAIGLSRSTNSYRLSSGFVIGVT